MTDRTGQLPPPLPPRDTGPAAPIEAPPPEIGQMDRTDGQPSRLIRSFRGPKKPDDISRVAQRGEEKIAEVGQSTSDRTPGIGQREGVVVEEPAHTSKIHTKIRNALEQGMKIFSDMTSETVKKDTSTPPVPVSAAPPLPVSAAPPVPAPAVPHVPASAVPHVPVPAATSEKQQFPEIVMKEMLRLVGEGTLGDEYEYGGKTYTVSLREGAIRIQERGGDEQCLSLVISKEGKIQEVYDGRLGQSQLLEKIPEKWVPLVRLIVNKTYEKTSAYSSNMVGVVRVNVIREGVRECPVQHARKLLREFSYFRRPITEGMAKAVAPINKEILGVYSEMYSTLIPVDELELSCSIDGREDFLRWLNASKDKVSIALTDSAVQGDEYVKEMLTSIFNDLEGIIKIVGDKDGYTKQLKAFGRKTEFKNQVEHLRDHLEKLEVCTTDSKRVTFFRTSVSFIGQEGGDAGALSRDYLNELMIGLMSHGDVKFLDNEKYTGIRYPVSKKEFTSMEKLPSVGEEERQQYTGIGQLMMRSYNTTGNLCLLGRHFDDTIFKIACSLTPEEVDTKFEDLTAKTKCKMARAFFAVQKEEGKLKPKVFDGYNAATGCLEKIADKQELEASDIKDLKTYLEIALDGPDFETMFGDDKAKFLKNPVADQKRLKEVLEHVVFKDIANRFAPIHAIAQGMKSFAPITEDCTQDQYWRNLQEVSYHTISDKIQGALDPREVANAIELVEGEDDPALIKKVKWLKKWVGGLGPEELRGFLEWVTGSSGLPPGQKITVRKGAKETGKEIHLPVVSTCHFLIDLSPGEMTEKGFIDSLKKAMVESKGSYTLV